MSLAIDLGRNLKISSPVMLASGTASYGEELNQFIDLSKIGAIVTKAISREPREGNAPPRIVETPSGMLNAIGLANVGVKNFLKEKVPFLSGQKTSIIVNVVGKSIDDYCEVVSRIDGETDSISAFELNLSCPNVKGESIIFGTSTTETCNVVSAVRKVTKRHIMVKLSPNVTSIADIAVSAEQAGADSISAINTLVGMSVDYRTKKPKLRNITGGLSGPAVKPIALAKVWEIHQAVKIPIAGIGGISSFEDAMEFFLVGASAVQIGTINFVMPTAALKIANKIAEHFPSTEDFQKYVGALIYNKP